MWKISRTIYQPLWLRCEMSADRFTIKSWAKEDRPREKLLSQGRSAMTDAELLAIIIGSGSKNESAVQLARKLLASVNNSLDKLGKLSVKDLIQFKGVGEAKAIAIISAIEIGRRRGESEKDSKSKITSSQDAYLLIKHHLEDKHNEEFWILTLDRGHHVLAKHQISKGGVSSTIVDPKLIYNIALAELASSIVLVHNHPSGNLKPSQADMKLTKKISDAGKLLDIKVLDHLIVSDSGYFSFLDEGLI